MKIILKEVAIREVTAGYKDSAEEGVLGFGGKLNIRPKYQREFVYKDAQRNAVIESIQKNYPLNVMYWVVNASGSYELLDGQQRTLSICQYVAGDFSINYKYFHNLTDGEQDEILNYKLMIYFCEGNDKEKLDWFKIINIAGEKLTDQEMRNAVYTGEWLTDAKRHFSKSGCAAYQVGGGYLNGSAIRQEYLETALDWISKGAIEIYMANHQRDKNASELWQYFQNVINWVKIVFPAYRKEMKGLPWGDFYNRFRDEKFDAQTLDKEVSRLMADEDVTKKSGIYEYLLSGQERCLSIRSFDDRTKRTAYEGQGGICVHCQKHFELSDMEADHISPWHSGGKTLSENCQMLCKNCNRTKSGK